MANFSHAMWLKSNKEKKNVFLGVLDQSNHEKYHYHGFG